MSQQPNRAVQHAKRGEGSVRKLARPNSKREEHSAARVEEFLATALNLFAERNFASVTIKDIAEHLGVNTALIYYYFDSKTDLFQASIEHAVAGASRTSGPWTTRAPIRQRSSRRGWRTT
jgi:AcrR family transcriptional regulator